jgi:biofilm PGA synthesis N-glycosyltransferase PgaC
MSQGHKQRDYLIITPCRDEADYLQVTIDTVAAQTVKPACWVIVDDGSTDATPEILRAASEKHDFIKVVGRQDRGGRAVGPGVIQAFNSGLEAVNLEEYDYVCKMDADLELPRRYFERLMEEMERDAALGAVSGKMFLRHDDIYGARASWR